MLKFLRNLLRRVTGFLPLGVRKSIDIRFRAVAEMGKLRRASLVVVSYPKSGRTWIRALLSYVLQQAYDLDTEELLGNRNYQSLDARAPVAFFTHDTYPRQVYGDARVEALYSSRKVILLVRDPRDVEVSDFFQVAYRGDPLKKRIYGQQASGDGADVFAYLKWVFTRDENALVFLNRWASMLGSDNVLVVRYEDLKVATVQQLQRICDFIGVDSSEAALQAAADRASYSSMRKGEREGAFTHQTSRFGSAGQRTDDAYKVRKGKVGGYRDYMTPAEAAEIDAIIDARLVPGFGYRSDETATVAARAGR